MGCCGLADAFTLKGLAGELATSIMTGGRAAAFSVRLPVSLLRNCSSSLPLMAARIQVIQMGRAARAPVSFSPRV
jgi:hypothetical protein